MNRLQIVFASLLLIVLCGCAAMAFTKPGASDAEYSRDWNDCRVKANQAGETGVIPWRNFMQECMEGQGWTRTN